MMKDERMKDEQKMNKWMLLFCICSSFICSAFIDLPASSQQETTKLTLVTERTAITPGKPIKAGVLLEAKEGWHTYWENPGDAGMPTDFTWTLPAGFNASPIDWPTPQRLTEGPLVTHSYVGTVFLPVTITPPATLDGTSYPIKVKVDLLVCKEICIPESGELQVTLPVSATEAPTTPYATLFDQHLKNRPQPIDSALEFSINGNQLALTVPLEALSKSNVTSANFFTREMNIVNYAAEQKLTLDKHNLTLSIERTEQQPAGTISGILTVKLADGSQASYNIIARSTDQNPLPSRGRVGGGAYGYDGVSTSPPPNLSPNGGGISFISILFLAMLGGLVLNLMPCVLPILSLKALAIAKKSGGKHEHVVRLGVAYTLGILVSFAIIAGLLLALRNAGESVGWGYQMQSPAFVGFLIYLLFIVGLNLSGLFHLPVLLGHVGSNIANESSARGSFFTGILATAVATPCTAPFMAGAVGAALTMPAWQALIIFEALGFGLALPFLLISLFPRLRAFLPKPGAWMDIFKQLLAFPMYGSVIWLMWVLTLQTGAGGTVIALTGMLAIVFAIWMKSWLTRGYRIVALTIYILVTAFTLPMLAHMEISTAATPGKHLEHEVETVNYSKAKLAELRQAGKPVFVDATAAWCITCQVNARVALHTERTMAEFKRLGITLLIADWTRRNDEITEFLSEFGFSGVPLCVFYPAHNGKPVVLPQLLTEDIVLSIITAKGD